MSVRRLVGFGGGRVGDGFDIIYACQDAKFDQGQGLHSVPARFGVAGALRVAAAAHVFMLIVLAAWLGLSHNWGLGAIYYLALLVVAVLVIVQHRLVSPMIWPA